MRVPRSLILGLSLLIGCAPSTAPVGLEGSSGDTGDTQGLGDDGSGDTSGDTSDDTGDGGDTSDTTVDDPPPFPYTGDYSGTMVVDIDSEWGAYEFAECEMQATVTEDGDLSGEAVCALAWGGGGSGGGWGEDYTYPFSGSVSDAGAVKGTLDVDFGEPIALDMSGEISSAWVMTLDVYGEITDWRSELFGEAKLERE